MDIVCMGEIVVGPETGYLAAQIKLGDVDGLKVPRLHGPLVEQLWDSRHSMLSQAKVK